MVTAICRLPSQFPAHERAEGWLGVTSVADEIRAKGRRALAMDCDVTRREDIAECVFFSGWKGNSVP